MGVQYHSSAVRSVVWLRSTEEGLARMKSNCACVGAREGQAVRSVRAR